MIDKWQTFIFTSGSQDLVLDALDTFCVEGGTLISSRSSPVAMCAVQILFTLCSQPSPEYDVLCPVGYVRLLQSTFLLSMYCLCGVDGFRNDRQSSDGRWAEEAVVVITSPFMRMDLALGMTGGERCFSFGCYVYHEPSRKAKWALRTFV